MRTLIRLAPALVLAIPLVAGDWSLPSIATTRDGEALLTCRASLAGDYLLVELQADQGWHVYAMDNEQRSVEALAGAMSLGVEQNTEVQVRGGLELLGEWFQSEPRDFSRPELRWYSYGFEGTSLLAGLVRRTGESSATVMVRAQLCDSTRCVPVEAEMHLPVTTNRESDFTTDGLVRVRGL